MQEQGLVVTEEAKPELLKLTDLAIQTIAENIKQAEKLVFTVLEKDIDYGLHPGTESLALRDPGASKIANAFNTYPVHIMLHTREDEDVISYLVQANLISRTTGKVVGVGVGGCSTMESKYGYRYVWHPQDYGYDKSELKFKKGKGWRIPNPEVVDLGNTIVKMACKRSEIDACQSLPGVGSALRKLFGGGKPQEPPAPNWTSFWGQVATLGLSEDDVHQMLGVSSVKDWLSQGKSLNQAIELLSQKLTKKGAAEAEKPQPTKGPTSPPVSPAKKRKAADITPGDVPDGNALLKVAHECWGLQPATIWAELNYTSLKNFNEAGVESAWECWLKLKAVREPPPGEESQLSSDEGPWD